MTCALKTILRREFEDPDHRELRNDLIKRYKNDPQYFVYMKSSLEHSLPNELGFDQQVVRMTCDTCAIDPLKECDFMDAVLDVLKGYMKDGPGTGSDG